MANLAVLLALFWRYSRIIGFPILAALIVVLIAFEVTGSTDNHQFRHQVPAREIARPSVEESFRTWIASRADLEAYRSAGKPYPLYIVAAEGGGLYAAYQTAKLLGRMQDLCRNFAQHVFVTSSVSGGSLGLGRVLRPGPGVVPRTSRRSACKAVPQTRRAVREGRRHTSCPEICSRRWSGRRCFPTSCSASSPIRSRSSIVATRSNSPSRTPGTIKGGPKKNYLQGSFFELCGARPADCAKGATRRWALNMTNVETGMQMVLSQMDLSTWPLDEATAPVRRIQQRRRAGRSARQHGGRVERHGSRGSRRRAGTPSIHEVRPASGAQAPHELRRRRLRRQLGRRNGHQDRAPALLHHQQGPDAAQSGHQADRHLGGLDTLRSLLDRSAQEPARSASTCRRSWPRWLRGRAAATPRRPTSRTDRAFKVIDMGVYYNFMPLPVGWHLSTAVAQVHRPVQGPSRQVRLREGQAVLVQSRDHGGSYIYRANCSAAEDRQGPHAQVARPRQVFADRKRTDPCSPRARSAVRLAPRRVA